MPARALGLLGHGGRADPPQWPGGVGLAGVEEHGISTPGFPRNLGRPAAPSRQKLAPRESQTRRPLAPGRRRRAWVKRTQPPREGIAKRTTRKRGEMVRRESERLMVPTRTGNPTRGGPAEGRGRRVAE